MIDDYVFLTKEEFKKLDNSTKWNYVESLVKLLKDAKPMIEKNCGECENYLLDVNDVNIDFLFEDWRDCSNYCDECNEEMKTRMCQLQYELMQHISQAINELRTRQNALTKLVLKKGEERSFGKFLEKENKKDKESKGIYT